MISRISTPSFNVFALLALGLAGAIEAASDIGYYNRDNFNRANPNTLLKGFFPAWTILLFCLCGKSTRRAVVTVERRRLNDAILVLLAAFLVVAALSLSLYALGCKPPRKPMLKTKN